MEHGSTGASHSRTALGTVLVTGMHEVDLFSWCSRARWLVGSVARRQGGLPAHRPPMAEAPVMRGCALLRDRTTKPSRGRLPLA